MKEGYYFSIVFLIAGCALLIMNKQDDICDKLEKQIKELSIQPEGKDSIHFACVKCGWPNRLATADTLGLIRRKNKK